MSLPGRVLDRIEDALAFLAATLLVFTVAFVPIDVASRYFFNAPLTWVFEVTEYILLMMPCLGMAWLARNNGHVVVDIVTSRLGDRNRSLLAGLVAVLVALVCGFIAWWGAVVTWRSYQTSAVIENVLQTPQWLIYIAIPIGFGLCALEFGRKGLESLGGVHSLTAAR